MNTKGYQLADGSWSSEYKVGDKFVVSCDKHHKFGKGQVVVYIEDDYTDSPRFMDTSKEKAYCYWSRLSKYKEEESMDKPINTFKKEDLKTGMIIVFKDGQAAMVLRGTVKGDIYSGETWAPLDSNFDENLVGKYPNTTVVKIYQPKCNIAFLRQKIDQKMTFDSDYKLLWEREEISPLQKDFDELQSQIKALQEKPNTIQQQSNTSKLKNDISIEWNNGNANIIHKLLQELGYSVWRTREYNSTEGWNYIGIAGLNDAFQGKRDKSENHFTSLEDFLKYHFSEEKTPLEVEFEELQAQIKTLSDKAAEIKAKLN